MKKVIYILILILMLSCSAENASNAKTSNENSGLSNLLDSANKEISSLGESDTEKDGLIDRITQELASSNNSLDILNNSLEALKLQNIDLNGKNLNLSDEILNLSDEIEKLLEEKLLLEMSIKNLRTQYEAAVIEKSVESNKSKNIENQEQPKKSEIPTVTKPELKNNDKTNDFETAGLSIRIGGKNESNLYLSSSVSEFNDLNPDSKVELDFVDDAFKSFKDGEIDIAIDEQ